MPESCSHHEPAAHTARLNGLEPYAYLKNVLERLPKQLNTCIRDLLPYRGQP
ncbi:transposase domain-containing protein [Acidovorax sp. BLS4]|uniref:transposase domain-containing protein n=1 Tax=Acidovorax sp. BLS4 TaxID=3273430 RepID=UPI00355B84CD